MYTSIEVYAPARLHLGFYSFRGLNTGYGGVGLAVEPPFIRVRIARSTGLEVVNHSGVEVEDVIHSVLDKLGVDDIEIKVYSAIPRHVGLGSTTQLTLAIGLGISKLFNLGYSIRELATMFGRGYVSGIGIGVFEQGGFIVDSGRRLVGGVVTKPRKPDDLPLVIARYSFPQNWYFIVIVPETKHVVTDREERKYLRKPLRLDPSDQLRLYQVLLQRLIPSIITENFEEFSKALYQIQVLTGKYFSKHQGGVYCCRETEQVIKELVKHGIRGVGQSSWGPVAYGVVDNYFKANRIMKDVVKKLEEIGIRIRYSYVAKPRNRGYLIRF